MKTLAELDSQFSLVIPAAAQDLITGYKNTDPWAQQANDIQRALIMSVSLAKEIAVSYRDFKVGAIGTALTQKMENGDDIIRSFSGTNIKRSKDDPLDVHAEEAVLSKAERAKVIVSSLAIYGDNQPDDESGLFFPALPPCSRRCLPLMLKSPAMHEKTVITGLSSDRKTIMLYGVRELLNAYESGRPDSLTTVELSAPLVEFGKEPESSMQEDASDEAFVKIARCLFQRQAA